MTGEKSSDLWSKLLEVLDEPDVKEAVVRLLQAQETRTIAEAQWKNSLADLRAAEARQLERAPQPAEPCPVCGGPQFRIPGFDGDELFCRECWTRSYGPD